VDDIEGLSEALKGLQEALDKVKELLPSDASEEETDAIDTSTEETDEHAADDATVHPSVTDEEDDMKKSAAVASLQKLMG
jgi:hypothetical protein